jgi:hypothetical protein
MAIVQAIEAVKENRLDVYALQDFDLDAEPTALTDAEEPI